jgi:hypothetical protein
MESAAKLSISEWKISGFLNYFENSCRPRPELSENRASATPLYIADVRFAHPGRTEVESSTRRTPPHFKNQACVLAAKCDASDSSIAR